MMYIQKNSGLNRLRYARKITQRRNCPMLYDFLIELPQLILFCLVYFKDCTPLIVTITEGGGEKLMLQNPVTIV